MEETLMAGKCAYCFWWINLRRCHPSRAITNPGNCLDWRLRKMTEAEKAKEAKVMKAAHDRDRQKKAKK